MAQIGRKIYYELSTGNVIVDTGERQGAVVETTEDQDFAMYAALQSYQRSAVGVLLLNFGDNAQNFATYPYHIDVSQNPPAVVWDVNNPYGATLDQLKATKKAQLDDLCNQAIAAGYQSSALGVAHTYQSDDNAMIKIQTVLKRLELNPDTTATADYFTVDAGFLPHTLAQLNQVFCDGVDAGMVYEQKKAGLYSQVDAATTVDEVNAITW